MPSKVWDEITFPFPNFNGATLLYYVVHIKPKLLAGNIGRVVFYESNFWMDVVDNCIFV